MSETLIRALSGAVYIAILLTACLYSDWSFKTLMAIFLLIATVEFSKLIRFNVIIGLFLAIGLYVLLGCSEWLTQGTELSVIENNWILIGGSIATSFFLIQNLFSDKSLIIKNVFLKYFLLIGYIIFSFIIIIKIPYDNLGNYKPEMIIGLFVLLWINDTFAYIIGKTFGKHKLLERISPKKTIEGFIGGALFTIIFSTFIAQYLEQNNALEWILISIIVIVFGTLGDLVESKFKRSANVKDSGNIMPGHGGILDRLDSIIFVAPFVFLFYQIIS